MQEAATFDWQGFAIVGLFLAGWGGLLLWAVKAMLDRPAKHLDERFAELSKQRGESDAKRADLEREVLDLKAALPREYVRREDWIRFGGVIDAKIDHLHTKVDGLKDRVYER